MTCISETVSKIIARSHPVAGKSDTEVKLSDLFIFQDNKDADAKHVARIIKALENGDEIEPILVLPITPKLKKDLRALKNKLAGSSTHSKYAEGIDDALFSTTKKYILLDGNHRYLAAQKFGLKNLPAEVDKMSAEDYVDYIHEEF